MSDADEEGWHPKCEDCEHRFHRRDLNPHPVHIPHDDGMGYDVVDVLLCHGCRKERMPTHECERCGTKWLDLVDAVNCCPDRQGAPLPDGGTKDDPFMLRVRGGEVVGEEPDPAAAHPDELLGRRIRVDWGERADVGRIREVRDHVERERELTIYIEKEHGRRLATVRVDRNDCELLPEERDENAN